MTLFRFAAAFALGSMLLAGADFSPNFKGATPITVHSDVSSRKGKVGLTAEVENITDATIDEVTFCVKVEPRAQLDEVGCLFHWTTYDLKPHKAQEESKPDLPILVKLPDGQVPHEMEILSMKPDPPAASTSAANKTPAGPVANCGTYQGPVFFDQFDDNKAAGSGWFLFPYVVSGAKERIYFNGKVQPLTPSISWPSRWTFWLEVKGDASNVRPQFDPVRCTPGAPIDILVSAGLASVGGGKVGAIWGWEPDDSPGRERHAFYKLVARITTPPPASQPRLMSLRSSGLKIERIVSARILEAKAESEFLTNDEIARLQPAPNRSTIQIPIQPQFEGQNAIVVASARIGPEPTLSTRIFCFPLTGSEVLLDEKETGPGCEPLPVREIKFNLTGNRYGRDIHFVAVSLSGGGRDIILGPSALTMRDKTLPDAIQLRDDLDFADSNWEVKGQIEVPIDLKPRTRVLTFQFNDGTGELVTEQVLGTFSIEHQPEQPISGSSNKVSVGAITGDKIRIKAASAHFSVDATLAYKAGIDLITVPMIARTELPLAPPISVSLRPYFRARGKEQPVAATSINVQYVAGAGRIETLELKKELDSWVGKLAAPVGAPMTASIELPPGMRRVLTPSVRYPIANPNTKNSIEVNFSKPTLAVVLNPSARFRQRNVQDEWLGDIKAQVWRIFEDLNKKWDQDFAYRYFSAIKSDQMEVLKPVETTTLDLDPDSRKEVLDGVTFGPSNIEVTPLNATRSYARFLDGFSYPRSSNRGILIYVQAVATDPLDPGDAVLDEWDAELKRLGIKAVVVQLGLGTGEPRTLTDPAKHHSLILVQFFMEAESKKGYFSHAFDQVMADYVEKFREAK